MLERTLYLREVRGPSLYNIYKSSVLEANVTSFYFFTRASFYYFDRNRGLIFDSKHKPLIARKFDFKVFGLFLEAERVGSCANLVFFVDFDDF